METFTSYSQVQPKTLLHYFLENRQTSELAQFYLTDDSHDLESFNLMNLASMRLPKIFEGSSTKHNMKCYLALLVRTDKTLNTKPLLNLKTGKIDELMKGLA